MVLRRAEAAGIEMPIVAAVVQVLDGKLAPEQALGQLLRREARPESL
jgi:glycerol-3-phosphate dehydrogenase (NAD(P)+)